MSMRLRLARAAPGLGRFSRFLRAFIDSRLPARESYSQHGEDRLILELLGDADLSGSVYVDVGAGHPTEISNTYLLYRRGLRGIVIDPNPELIGLHRRFRRRDTAVCIGCGDANAVLGLTVSKTPVATSFRKGRPDLNAWYETCAPVLRLDDALRRLPCERISLLSVDVEGMNPAVLEGAPETLSRTAVLCVEFDDENDRKAIDALVGPSYELVREIGCNRVYRNRRYRA